LAERDANFSDRSIRGEIMQRLLFSILILSVILFFSCSGDNYKTPSDIKGEVAFLSAESALPNFPFGTDPIYIYFHTERSPYCVDTKELIFKRPEIIEYINEHFTSIIVEPDSLKTVNFAGQEISIRKFLKDLQVEGLPSHYFFNYKGEIKGARTGYIRLLEFKQLLKYTAEGYIEKQSFNSFRISDEAELDTVWGEFE